MRGSRSALSAWMLSLLLLVLAQISFSSLAPRDPPDGPKGKKGVDPPALSTPPAPVASTSSLASASIESSSSSTSSRIESFFSSTSSPVTFSTSTNTIDVSSFMTSSTSTNSSVIEISTSTSEPSSSRTLSDTGLSSTPSLMLSSTPTATAMSITQHGMSTHQRNLIIILSTVLGCVGLILIAGAIFLIYRYRNGGSPFGHRGASPINDDEIDSWRGTGLDKKKPISPVHRTPPIRDANSIALANSPGWTWTASPTSMRSALSPSASVIPDTPSFLARAPNARAGLTDEAVPGADPFVATIKRQSSRLSKAPPGHARTKSRRSSMSAKSTRSYNVRASNDSKAKERGQTWFDPDDEAIGKALRDTPPNSNSPGTSIFDGLSPGGLSPRPKSQPRPWEDAKDIGRAIA